MFNLINQVVKYRFSLLAISFFFTIDISSAKIISAQPIESSSKDQVAVEVTIYKNMALIKDSRSINLLDKDGELKFIDVPSSIIPVSVHIKSDKNSLNVLEQNYEYDLIEPEKLLDKYVGKKIKLVDWNRFKDRKEIVEATLLSNNKGQVYKIDDDIYIGHEGYKVLPGMPEELSAHPTLKWIYKSNGETKHKLDVSYLTRDMTWNADYILVLNDDDKSGDLSGWVSLDNKSGATYKNAGLKLVAGDLNIIESNRTTPGMNRRKAFATMDMAEKEFTEQPFFEYHIYDLQRKTTVKDRQIKQIDLLKAAGVALKREYIVAGNTANIGRGRLGKRGSIKTPVDVFISFINSSKNNLGTPLPAGVVRLYKKDQKQSLQFAGEDSINHTPADEEVKLKVGRAFDIVAYRTLLEYKQVTTMLHESKWEVVIRNRKTGNNNIQLGVVETLFGNWKIVESSHPYSKLDAFNIRFDVDIPAGEEVKVQYKTRIGLE